MPFTIGNDPSAGVGAATYTPQAQLDKGDLDLIVAEGQGTGFLTGGVVSPNSSGVSLNVNVTAGSGLIQGGWVVWAAVTNLTVGAANATNPRLDLVVVSTAGTVSILAGAAAVTPDYPALTFDGAGNLNQLVFAAVTVPANATSITAGNLADKRIPTMASTPLLHTVTRAMYR